MRPYDRYQGGDDPFEGERTLWLRSLPAGARVTKATVTLTPVKGSAADAILFQETFTFPPATPGEGELSATAWGVSLVPTDPSPSVEVDFHARRTLAAVQGTQGDDLAGASLQVDMGGAYVGIANDGTFIAPDKDVLVIDLSTDPTLPGLTVDKFKLSGVLPDPPDDALSPTKANLNLTKVTIRSVPTNVSVRLDEMPPFWTRLGELVTAATSPDFSDVLNAFLAEASAEDGFYAVPFVVHSDTIARLDVTLAIDYVIERPILPPYLPEVTLPYGYSGLPGIEEDLLTLKLPRGATVAGTGGAVQGAFDASRVVFPKEIDTCEAETTVTVSPDRSLAQPIQLAEETPASGIDLPLANTQPGLAGLHLALQEDADGKPSGEVRTSAEVTVEKPAPGGSAWGSAALPAEFRFEKNERYWLVLQSVSGEAYWDVGPGDPAAPLQASTDGGFSWRTATTSAGEKPLAALFRLRHTPERFSVPVQLEVGEGLYAKRVKFDDFAPLGRVEFDLDFATELEEYLDTPAAVSPCGTGELLTNGGFDQPPHDDATRRLFGLVSYEPGILHGGVDLRRGVNLNVERFITLSGRVSPTRIDCAGTNPAHTSLPEIINAINQVMGPEVAFEVPSTDDSSVGTGKLGLLRECAKLHDWCKAEVPAGWQGRRVVRAKVLGEMVSILAAPPSLIEGSEYLPCLDGGFSTLSPIEPATLIQRIPVAGGCTYVLRFLFLIADSDPQFQASSWEIHWLDAERQLIHSESEKLYTHGRSSSDVLGRLQCEVRLVAPPDATEAEIRFSQPPTGFLVLSDVSFSPTREALRNSNFSQWEVESDDLLSPVGWTRLDGSFDWEPNGDTVRLRGDGPGDTILSQTVAVFAGERYELRVLARPVSPPADDAETRSDQQRARLELCWLTGEGEIGEPVILPLDGRDFPTRAWAGTAPDGATQAEIRLVQPQGGGDLLVESVSLSQVDLVSVPLTFLAEAPGELAVSDLRVAYEPPGPPPELPPPRPAVQGAPPSQVAAAAPQPPTIRRMVEPATPRPRSPLADRSIGIIAGVGDRFSDVLGRLSPSVTTVAELAALDPEAEVEGISRERRLELKTKGEMIAAITVEAAPFATLADEPLEILLALPPAELARRSGQPAARAEQLQRDLRALRLLLKKDAFRSLRLSDLMPGG